MRDLFDAVDDAMYRAELPGQVLTSPKDEFTNDSECVSPGPFAEDVTLESARRVHVLTLASLQRRHK